MPDSPSQVFEKAETLDQRRPGSWQELGGKRSTLKGFRKVCQAAQEGKGIQTDKVQEAKHIHCGKARSLVQQLESKKVGDEVMSEVGTVRENCPWTAAKI